MRMAKYEPDWIGVGIFGGLLVGGLVSVPFAVYIALTNWHIETMAKIEVRKQEIQYQAYGVAKCLTP